MSKAMAAQGALALGCHVMKSDVKGYDASIDHEVLMDLAGKHIPGKTFIGRASKGFDFLGYHFAADASVTVAEPTIRRHLERLGRLYEPGASAGRARQYVRRWRRWVASLVDVSEQTAGQVWLEVSWRSVFTSGREG
jgi:hypothetical protein